MRFLRVWLEPRILAIVLARLVGARRQKLCIMAAGAAWALGWWMVVGLVRGECR